MRGKPVDIGNTIRRNLITFRRTGNPEATPSGHDAGNGAAMRILPVALASLAWTETRFAPRCAQSHVTHNNPVSDAACELIVLSVRDFLNGEPLRHVYRQRIAQNLIVLSAVRLPQSPPRESQRLDRGYDAGRAAVLNGRRWFRALPGGTWSIAEAMPIRQAPSPACSPVPSTRHRGHPATLAESARSYCAADVREQARALVSIAEKRHPGRRPG